MGAAPCGARAAPRRRTSPRAPCAPRCRRQTCLGRVVAEDSARDALASASARASACSCFCFSSRLTSLARSTFFKWAMDPFSSHFQSSFQPCDLRSGFTTRLSPLATDTDSYTLAHFLSIKSRCSSVFSPPTPVSIGVGSGARWPWSTCSSGADAGCSSSPPMRSASTAAVAAAAATARPRPRRLVLGAAERHSGAGCAHGRAAQTYLLNDYADAGAGALAGASATSVDPNPPSPRAVSSSAVQTTSTGRATGSTSSCAMRSPGSIT